MVLNFVDCTMRVAVKDLSYVGTARRAAKEFGQMSGLQGEPLERLLVLTSELATNLAKHAIEGGQLIFEGDSTSGTGFVRVVSVDNGPGIADVESAMIDGVSGTGTLGAGLGSIKRLSDHFEISSTPGNGTIILAQITQQKRSTRTFRNNACLSYGRLSVAHPKETHCGDGSAAVIDDSTGSILLVDASGHGDLAFEAAQMAIEVFQKNPSGDPQDIVRNIHQRLLGSRGAAIALAQIRPEQEKLTFTGVGNIVARIFDRYCDRGCVSTDGIVGSHLGSVKVFEYEWNKRCVFLMHSDGLKSSARIDSCSAKSPSLMAAECYRDYSRGNDDACVVVVKGSEEQL